MTLESEAGSEIEAPTPGPPNRPGPARPAPPPEATEPASGADAWRARHGAAVDPLVSPLVKRAKRAAQDDQNALLDAVRRHKGRPSAEQVLRDDDTRRGAGRTCCATHSTRRTARAGKRQAPNPRRRPTTSCAKRPRRSPSRCATASRRAIDDGDDGDTSGLVERIGARYREWKNQQLERALGDVMVVAWSRGVYDGAADGTVLHWVPLADGRCADCDDNALEPTVKGEAFPTGQTHPPAHPGCRCLLAPAAVLVAGDPPMTIHPSTSIRPMRVTSADVPRRPLGLRGWLIGAAVVLVFCSLEPARPRALLHRLPVVQRGRFRRHVAPAALGQGSSRR